MPPPLTAPGRSRLLACLLYEILVVAALLMIGFLIPQAVLNGNGWHASPKFLWLHIFILLLPYFLWFWLNGGQTLPMKTWKLRLRDENGGPPRPLQALLRYLAAWASLLLLGLGFLWLLLDRERRTLHDRIAGTRIVQETPPR